MNSQFKRKILFLFPRSPFNFSSGNNRRQYLIYSTLKEKFETRILTFGKEYYQSNEQEVIQLKKSNLKKIFNFAFRLQSPRITHYKSKKFKAALEKNLKSFKPDIIYVEHLLMMQYIINLKTKANIVFFNDESNWFVEENDLRGNFYQSLRNFGLVRLEKSACSRTNLVLTITDEESHFLRNKGIKNVETISYGVDADYFRFEWKKPEDKTILFVGDYSHYPNRQAARILVKKILPLLSDSEIKLRLVGRNTHRLKNLRRVNVEISENVPDVRLFYNNSALFAAPVFSGAGLRVKVLEAALCGILLIISPAANLGIDFTEGEEAFLCNSTGEFVKVIKDFFSSKQEILFDAIRLSARKKVIEKFDEALIREKIRSVFYKLCNT